MFKKIKEKIIKKYAKGQPTYIHLESSKNKTKTIKKIFIDTIKENFPEIKIDLNLHYSKGTSMPVYPTPTYPSKVTKYQRERKSFRQTGKKKIKS